MIRKVSVMEENWDYLIILDACRYDYFSKLYGDYLCGRLEKVISLASCTLEWCKRSFQERYDDVVYISGNPFINSMIETEGFNAKDHFYRVIDLWNWGWNEELGTVHPEKVNKAVQSFKDDYLDKRFIIHYLQPHAPYLGCNLLTPGFPKPQINRGRFLTNIQNSGTRGANTYLKTAARALGTSLVKILAIFAKAEDKIGFLGKPSWKIRELLNLPPASPMDAARRKVGESGLRQAYVENLRLVLKYVARLVEDLSGVIIITADHGELLGEGGRYSHSPERSDPLLVEVPWFKIEKDKKKKRYEVTEENKTNKELSEQTYGAEEEEEFKKRLRSLGYL